MYHNKSISMYTKDAGLRQCVILEMKTNAQSMVKGYRSTAPSPQDDQLSHYVHGSLYTCICKCNGFFIFIEYFPRKSSLGRQLSLTDKTNTLNCEAQTAIAISQPKYAIFAIHQKCFKLSNEFTQYFIYIFFL